MPVSLLHALLERSHQFTEDDFLRLHEGTKRLLASELYEALARDSEIMPLLVDVLREHDKPATAMPALQALFTKLAARIGAGYEQITQL